MTHTTKCFYCKRQMPGQPPEDNSAGIIAGGICPDCISHVGAQAGLPLADFLETIDVPVMLVDADAVVLAANQLVRALVNKQPTEIRGYRGGEVFECAYSHLPGGCGKTAHCSGCAIRKTVMDTFVTGRGSRNVMAHLHQKTDAGPAQLGLSISTEKVYNMVLLKVDRIE